jgi:hypothetical protein
MRGEPLRNVRMLRWSDADLAAIVEAAGTKRGAFAAFVRESALLAAKRKRPSKPNAMKEKEN